MSAEVSSDLIRELKSFTSHGDVDRTAEVLQFDRDPFVAFRYPNIDADPATVDRARELEANRCLRVPLVDQPGQRMLEIGFRMEDGPRSRKGSE